MAGVLRLKHIYPNELPDQKFYFYEGEVDVHFGVIELPADPAFEHWALRAWMKGFRLDPETDQPVDRDRLSALLMHTSTESAVSATEESADAGTDVGRQSVGEDGLRESELPRSSGLSEEGLDGSNGDGAAVPSAGDEPAD